MVKRRRRARFSAAFLRVNGYKLRFRDLEAYEFLIALYETGRFRFEQNDDPLNTHGSPFFSLHHLFCNPTEVLLTALVVSNGTGLECGTRQYPPNVLVQNPSLPFVEVRVRF